ncbi:MAG: single-stranded-DNA-specific exonuclease RecJ [Proteobacteria bacterium]|nr:single-stranded-DNA-specific exonuclease RecJ [Pseudomonadota bacterium]
MEKQPSLSFCGAKWRYQPDENRINEIMAQNHVSRALASCLALRGFTAGAEIEHFLTPSLSDLHDPFLMLGMSKAVERFQQAIDRKEKIRVVTDYDADGTMSSLILQSTLKICGTSEVSYHIPDRKVEGYGFSMAAAQKAVSDRIGLIVTADIGVRDEASIAYAAQHGIDVIVLDHHLPPGAGIPDSAYAVLCPPQNGCNYPNKSLAACGISLKFAQAMLKNAPRASVLIRSMMKLAAMGTVADVVSLRDPENRAIVTFGLQALNSDPHRQGLKALLDVSRALPGAITSATIGYNIGPRINAAGRLASANLIIELLNAPNSIIAAGLASQLNMMNDDRQAIQELMVQHATEMLKADDSPFLVIALPEDPCWHSGIAGIVAGRLRERFNRPVAVATISAEGMVTGSIRSTPGVHAVKALTSVSHLLTKFGGHAAAAGFSCESKNLKSFCAGLNANAQEQLHGEPEIPVTEIAVMCTPAKISTHDLDELERLEPCGAQNAKPMICIRNARMSNPRIFKEKVFSATIADTNIKCLWFTPAIPYSEFTSQPLNLVGEMLREKTGTSTVYKLIIRDACPASADVFI